MAQNTQLSRAGTASLGVPSAGVSAGAEGHAEGVGSAMPASAQSAQSAIVELTLSVTSVSAVWPQEPVAGLASSDGAGKTSWSPVPAGFN